MFFFLQKKILILIFKGFPWLSQHLCYHGDTAKFKTSNISLHFKLLVNQLLVYLTEIFPEIPY